VAGAAAGTMSDVVGLDGAWVSDFVKQGSIANLTDLMAQAGYDDSELASQIQLNGSTYMIPVVNFVYPVFVNLDLMEKAGIANPPASRTEFADAATKLTDAENNVYGWVLPLSMEQPNGIQNDVMSWVWASGSSMMKDGQPDLTNEDVRSAMEYIKGLYDAGVIAPGSFSMKEQDKVEEFTNGRVGMMVDSLAHINLIRERNPELNFAITALPAKDDYTGKRGLPYASWGIGISATSEHQAEAWKLVQFLMSAETNSKLSSIANAFPGNVNSTPDFVQTDELFGAAFEVFQAGYLANEFVGLPVAEELMRLFDEQFQLYLDGSQSLDDALNNAQTAWMENFDSSAAASDAPASEAPAEAAAAPAGEPVTLEFTQWWEPELPAGEFRALMDEFEAQNPGIKVELISGPYASTKEQVVAGAAAGTMSDVVGLDGAWVSDFVVTGQIK
jgi:multiple sugar transport system substrate-binding protein